MADSYNQLAVDSTGSKIQSYQNTVSGNAVEAQVVAVIVGGSNSFVDVAPDSTGKRIKYFQNTIGADDVHAIAVCRVNTSGAAL